MPFRQAMDRIEIRDEVFLMKFRNLLVPFFLVMAGTANAANDATPPAEPARPAAAAASDKPLQKVLSEALDAYAQKLAARGDAHSLLAAAIVSPIRPTGAEQDPGIAAASTQVQGWLREAVAKGQDDALVAWGEVMLCTVAVKDICDPAQASQRLTRLQPDNAAVSLLRVRQATAANDAAESDRWFHQAALAHSYRGPASDMTGLVMTALAEFDPGLNPEQWRQFNSQMFGSANTDSSNALPAVRFMYAMAHSAVAAGLPFGSLVSRCRAPIADAARRADCIAVATKLAAGDAVIDRNGGFMVLVPLLKDEAEGKAARESLRQFVWLFESSQPVLQSMPEKPELLAEYSRTFIAEGEIAAIARVLAKAGKSSSPPQDWLPDNSGYRSLVQTGDLPAVH